MFFLLASELPSFLMFSKFHSIAGGNRVSLCVGTCDSGLVEQGLLFFLLRVGKLFLLLTMVEIKWVLLRWSCWVRLWNAHHRRGWLSNFANKFRGSSFSLNLF